MQCIFILYLTYCIALAYQPPHRLIAAAATVAPATAPRILTALAVAAAMAAVAAGCIIPATYD